MITVTETHGPDGDLVYFVGITTHSRSALDRLAEVFDQQLHFFNPSDDGDVDLADALRFRARERAS